MLIPELRGLPEAAARGFHGKGSDPEAPVSLSMHVGVDTHDFRPWHYDEIGDIMMKKSQAQQALYLVQNHDHSEIGSPGGEPDLVKTGSTIVYVHPHSLCVSFKEL